MNSAPRAMQIREEPNNPASPDFRPGLFVKLASGPEGRVSTSGRRPAKKLAEDRHPPVVATRCDVFRETASPDFRPGLFVRRVARPKTQPGIRPWSVRRLTPPASASARPPRASHATASPAACPEPGRLADRSCGSMRRALDRIDRRRRSAPRGPTRNRPGWPHRPLLTSASVRIP